MTISQDRQKDEFANRLKRIQKGEGLVMGAVAPIEGKSLAKAKFKDNTSPRGKKKRKQKNRVIGAFMACIFGIGFVFMGEYVASNHADELNKLAGISADMSPLLVPYAVAGLGALVIMLMFGMRNSQHLVGTTAGIAAVTLGQPVAAEMYPDLMHQIETADISGLIKAQMHSFKIDQIF
jgi:hypothetical protein